MGMAYQFIHIETYARKCRQKISKGKEAGLSKDGRTVSAIFDEAERVPEACLHVENPQPPTVVYGRTVAETRAYHDAVVANLRDAQGRKARTTQNTLLAGVVSYPSERKDDGFEKWQRLNLEYLQKKYGDDLISVVRHDDESHPHLHFFVVPKDGNARLLNPGVREKLAAVANGASDKEGNRIYKEAMRQFQNEYFAEVGIKTGLQRIGPGRQRMSKGAYSQKCAEAELVAELYDEVIKDKKEAQENLKNAEIEMNNAKSYSMSMQIKHQQTAQKWSVYYNSEKKKLEDLRVDIDRREDENNKTGRGLAQWADRLEQKEKKDAGFLEKFKKKFSMPDFSKISELVKSLKRALRAELQEEFSFKEEEAWKRGFRAGRDALNEYEAGLEEQRKRFEEQEERRREIEKIPEIRRKIEKELGLAQVKPEPVVKPSPSRSSGRAPF